VTRFDSTAKVHPSAEIADDVAVGAFAVIGPHVRIGAGAVIGSHVVIEGHTELGRRNRVYPHAVIGTAPQDHTYRDEPTRVLIGDDNRIREFVTIHRGTVKGGGITVIGNENMFMACSHVGHDCVIGDRNVLSNNALLAGHVRLENGCILSGSTAVHQFVTLGSLAMIAGLTGTVRDVPPFMTMMTDPARPKGVNVIGMQRAGYTDTEIKSVQRAFRTLYRTDLSREKAVETILASDEPTRPVRKLADFVRRTEMGKLGRFLEYTRMASGEAP